jgi:ubiquinone/menaquinone biosynthesis C-methylase UbiE
VTDPKDIVARGYDQAARRYLDWSPLRPSATRLEYLDLARELIPPGAEVLELGCGAGVPMTAALAEGRHMTGVDISASQIALARRNVPAATFLQSDMTVLSFPDASFDAVVAFYSLTHVPRDEQPGLLRRIRTWLRPGGVFVATMGVEDDPGSIEPDWLGVDMYFSHFSAKKNRRIVEAAGFVVDRADVRTEPEDRHDARFLWVVAHVLVLILLLAACTTPSPPGASASPAPGTTPAVQTSPILPGYESPSPAS